MRKTIAATVFVFVALLAMPLAGEYFTTAPDHVALSSCEYEYAHAATVQPNTWIYRSNTGDYPQPYIYHAPGYGPGDARGKEGFAHNIARNLKEDEVPMQPWAKAALKQRFEVDESRFDPEAPPGLQAARRVEMKRGGAVSEARLLDRS